MVASHLVMTIVLAILLTITDVGTIEAHSREDCIELLKMAGREAADRKASCGIPMRSDGGESCYDAATKLEAYGERAIELCKDSSKVKMIMSEVAILLSRL